MIYLKITIGIFITLAITRFIPHPPNFTSLIAISFYAPVFFGTRYIPAVLVSFILTDLIIGLHGVTFFTWGSVLVIGLFSRYLSNSIYSRVAGSLIGACIFFIITNFGVWSLGYYGYSFNGLLNCYTLAIPFFTYSVISTLFYSSIFEGINKFYREKKFFVKSI